MGVFEIRDFRSYEDYLAWRSNSANWCGDCKQTARLFKGLAQLDEHHILPRRMGGSDDSSNLIYLCKSCHTKADAEVRRLLKGAKQIA